MTALGFERNRRPAISTTAAVRDDDEPARVQAGEHEEEGDQPDHELPMSSETPSPMRVAMPRPSHRLIPASPRHMGDDLAPLEDGAASP